MHRLHTCFLSGPSSARFQISMRGVSFCQESPVDFCRWSPWTDNTAAMGELLLWRQPQELSVVGEQVDRAIGTLLDIANALIEIMK